MPSDKDEIRARNDVVDVIGASVPLKKRGRNHVGLCPFHQEKTPSFNVDPVTQTFTCFGCGAKGDVFTFIEQYQNMSFVEAVEFLARRVGLTFERIGGPSREQVTERERMFELNQIACRYFEDKLQKVQSARSYLLDRGLSHETIKQFRLGFALDDWQAMAAYLHAQKQDLKLASQAGLLNMGKTGDYYDVFRNRVLFPILDEQERIVGFGGRAMGDEQPKYLNTGETPLFAKSKLLYGLAFARRKIASEERTLLMEGYTDVIAAHQAGFLNAVATLGTSLTDDHARKLARLAPTVVLVYDADNAGIKATLRASQILEEEGLQVQVAKLPAGEDPDSMLRKGDLSGFQGAIDKATGRVEYLLERVLAETDQSTPNGVELLQKRILHVLSTVQSASARDHYIEHVWFLHPLSSHGISIVKDQMHRDITAYAARRTSHQQLESPARGRDLGKGVVTESGYSDHSGQPYRPKDGSNRKNRQWPPHPKDYVQPVREGVKGPTSEERAEKELLRALAEPNWRQTVLQYIRPDELVTEDARRFAFFVQANLAELGEDPAALTLVLDRREDPEFSLRIRQHLQEIAAMAVKVPVTEAAIIGCAETLRRHRERGMAQRQRAELLQGRPEITGADRDRVRDYHSTLGKIKGTNSVRGEQGD